MSDSSGDRQSDPTVPNTLSDRNADGIPVEDLIKMTRKLTERITNLDRQRLALDLKHNKLSIKTNAPITLQQFFSGEIDLDHELAQRFSKAPLMSEVSVNPKRPEKVLPVRRAVAVLSTQDTSAQLTFDLEITTGAIEISFTLGNMLSFRFEIGEIDANERHRWLDLVRRPSGIAFLWTQERWEKDYIIFVIRENFARLYAFSPKRFEAGARITPDALVTLTDWLEAFWFPENPVEIKPPEGDFEQYHLAGASVSGDYMVSVRDTGTLAKVEAPKIEYGKDMPETSGSIGPEDETKPQASSPEDDDSDPSVLEW